MAYKRIRPTGKCQFRMNVSESLPAPQCIVHQSIRITPEAYAELEQAAEDLGCSMSTIIRFGIDLALEQYRQHKANKEEQNA